MPLRDFHGDLEWLEHELKADAARFADACGHLLHLPAALVSPGHSSHHVEHDVHEAHGALEISRAAVAAAAAARAAAAAARPVATRRGRGRAQQQPPPAVVHGLEPATAKGMQLAGLPAKPTGLALLAHPLRWSRSTRTLLAGAVSGCVSKTATAPIETVRIRLMTGGGTLAQVVQRTWDSGGVGAFWKGNMVNVARTVPTKAIQFAAFDAFKEALTVTDAKTGARTLPPWGGGVAGGLAGVASTCCMHPMETLQTRLAAGSYKGFGDCVVTLLRKEGPKALFGGLAPSLMGIIPYAGINLGSYDAMRTAYLRVTKADRLPKSAAFAMGAASGCTAATLCFPLEVVRRRMMMGGKYANAGEALLLIARTEGWQALFAGAGLNWLKMAPASGLGLVSYEMTKDALGLN